MNVLAEFIHRIAGTPVVKQVVELIGDLGDQVPRECRRRLAGGLQPGGVRGDLVESPGRLHVLRPLPSLVAVSMARSWTRPCQRQRVPKI